MKRSQLISVFERKKGYSSNQFDNEEWRECDAFIDGYLLAQEDLEKLYTKEEVLEQLNLLYTMKISTVNSFTDEDDRITMKWFENLRGK